MIKNIIFDLGNVLYRFDPSFILDQFPLNQNQKRSFLQAIFQSKEWQLLDQGLMSEEEAFQHMLTSLDPKDVDLAREVFMNWHLHLIEIDGMAPIIQALKNSGYHLYLLSNTSVRFLIFQSQCKLLNDFDGLFASALHQMAKPDLIIYQTFLKQFHLQAKECLFIDDVKENISGAKKAGIRGYQYTNPTTLLQDLKKIHLLP